MRKVCALSLMLVCCATCMAEKQKRQRPFPTEAVIGRDSFIDIGPPFDYYDLTFLVAKGDDTDVERVSLTPAADSCFLPAGVKTFHVVLHESLFSLLHSANPCDFSEKALNAERKRRKKGLPVFSGMNVIMQVKCAENTRIIRADILDRDIFEQHPNTPQYTSWSQALFENLDQVTGDRPWEAPVFPVSDAPISSAIPTQSAALQAIATGKYDTIFGKTSDRPSDLYRSAQAGARHPLIELTQADPVRPLTFVAPLYPPIAKFAHVHGNVDFHFAVGEDRSASSVEIDSGPKLLWKSTTDAIAQWKFAPEDAGKTVRGSIRFGLNCASDSK